MITYTREAPAGWTGHTGRIDAAMVAAAGHRRGRAYVCGSNGFMETVTRLLLAADFDPGDVRTERFGPTGWPAVTPHADWLVVVRRVHEDHFGDLGPASGSSQVTDARQEGRP